MMYNKPNHKFYHDRIELYVNPFKINKPSILDSKYQWDLWEKQQNCPPQILIRTFNREQKYLPANGGDFPYWEMFDGQIWRFPICFNKNNLPVFTSAELKHGWDFADFVGRPISLKDLKESITCYYNGDIYRFDKKTEYTEYYIKKKLKLLPNQYIYTR